MVHHIDEGLSQSLHAHTQVCHQLAQSHASLARAAAMYYASVVEAATVACVAKLCQQLRCHCGR
jgi:hypothetical protein